MTALFRRPSILAVLAALGPFAAAGPLQAQVAPFVQAVAETASDDAAIADFYRVHDYEPIWTGDDDVARRQALLTILSRAGDHGLPVARYDARALADDFRAAWTEGDRGRLEVRMTRALLDYARDVQTGALVPADVDRGIVREVPLRDRAANLRSFMAADPVAFLRALPPSSPDYAQLMRAKAGLEQVLRDGGWGPVVGAGTLAPGDRGPAVVDLRDRLVAMGYLRASATMDYDAPIADAVRRFQTDHGLVADGTVGETTMAEINAEPAQRLGSVVVAMERQRWINAPRGARHVWVNLTDFSAKIVDHGRVTFSTRAVVGKDVPDQRTPEFSDQMEFMVVNPSWSVPRSITVKEYLPLMQRNPNAAGHLQLVDRRGRTISRGSVNFGAYTAATFPYAMRQAPSDGNALGLVKFMFPNPYNIYLHDTPSKSLFDRESRAFSHGCIRLADPFDFAYALLSAQSDDPQGLFASHLKAGTESSIRLDRPIPVHLVYFTAFRSAKGRMNYRRDVYGRDARILQALEEAGVALDGVRG